MAHDPDLLDEPLRPHAERLAAQRDFVRALARRLVAPDYADDLAQEVLVAGLVHPPRAPGALRAWLATATRHLASKWHRGEARRTPRERAVASPEALPSTRELVERIELEQELVRGVLALGEPERTTLLLRFHEGLSPAEIAARLGLPADTVRARLRRGLERLRGPLDRRFGAHGLTALLLPIAGWSALPKAASVAVVTASSTKTAVAGGSSVASLGKAGLAVGVTAMATKAWLLGAAATAIVVAVGTGVLPTGLAPSDRGTPRLVQDGRSSAVEAAASAEVVATAPLAPESVRTVADPSESDRDAAEQEAAVALPPPGVVALQIVDGTEGTTLGDGVSIRFLSEQRFAQHDGGGEVMLPLTAGRWTARIHARGYEPCDLGAFEVTASSAQHLGRIPLQRGNGVIEGEVVAGHLSGDQPVRVELRGIGRGRCTACEAAIAHDASSDETEQDEVESAEPAPLQHACGDGDDPSFWLLAGSRRFRFDRLAEGTYWLRAFDPAQQIVDSCRVFVGRGGYVWRDLEVTAPTLAKVELRYANGALFHGDWSRFHREEAPAIEFTIVQGGKQVARGEARTELDDVRATTGGVLVPLTEAEKEGAAEPVDGWSRAVLSEYESASKEVTSLLTGFVERREASLETHALVAWAGLRHVRAESILESTWLASTASDSPQSDRLDRERQEGDSLDWSGEEPGVGSAELRIEKTRADAFTLAPLPRAQLELHVRCGGFESGPIALDLRFGAPPPLVVPLFPTEQRQQELAWIALPRGESCAACHSQQRNVEALQSGYWLDAKQKLAEREFVYRSALQDRREAVDTSAHDQ